MKVPFKTKAEYIAEVRDIDGVLFWATKAVETDFGFYLWFGYNDKYRWGGKEYILTEELKDHLISHGFDGLCGLPFCHETIRKFRDRIVPEVAAKISDIDGDLHYCLSPQKTSHGFPIWYGWPIRENGDVGSRKELVITKQLVDHVVAHEFSVRKSNLPVPLGVIERLQEKFLPLVGIQIEDIDGRLFHCLEPKQTKFDFPLWYGWRVIADEGETRHKELVLTSELAQHLKAHKFSARASKLGIGSGTVLRFRDRLEEMPPPEITDIDGRTYRLDHSVKTKFGFDVHFGFLQHTQGGNVHAILTKPVADHLLKFKCRTDKHVLPISVGMLQRFKKRLMHDEPAKIVIDIDDIKFRVSETRRTPHGFDVYMGWRQDKASSGPGSAILTPELAEHLLNHNFRWKLAEIPFGDMTLAKFRKRMGYSHPQDKGFQKPKQRKIKDVHGDTLIISSKRETDIGVTIYQGKYARKSYARPQTIFTEPLAAVIREWSGKPEQLAKLTGLSISIINQFRAQLGINTFNEKVLWWSDRLDDLLTLSPKDFSAKHGRAASTAKTLRTHVRFVLSVLEEPEENSKLISVLKKDWNDKKHSGERRLGRNGGKISKYRKAYKILKFAGHVKEAA